MPAAVVLALDRSDRHSRKVPGRPLHELVGRWRWTGHAGATGSGCPVSERAVFPDHEWPYEPPRAGYAQRLVLRRRTRSTAGPRHLTRPRGLRPTAQRTDSSSASSNCAGTTASRPGSAPADSSSIAGGRSGTAGVVPSSDRLIEEVSQRGMVAFGMRVLVADAPPHRWLRSLRRRHRSAASRGGGAHAPPQAP